MVEMKRRLSVVLAGLMVLTSMSVSFAAQGKKTEVIDSVFPLATPEVKGKSSVVVLKNAVEMSDMVSGADNGAARSGGLGGLNLPSDEKPGLDSYEVVMDKPVFKYITDGAKAAQIYHLTFGFPLGGVEFVDRKDISKFADGEMRLKFEKKSSSVLGQSAKTVVGNRPIVSFSVSAGGKTPSISNKAMLLSLPYSPSSGEDVSKLVLYRVEANGSVSQVANSLHKAVMTQHGDKPYIQALVGEPGTYAVGYKQVSYSDIKGWYKPYANFVMARGIMNEKKGMFSPNDPITRGDLAFYLKNMSDDRGGVSQSNFKDVPRSHPYANSIDWAYAKGLIKGYSDGSFKPDQVISRQELAAMLYRYIEVDAQVPMPTLHQKQNFKDGGKIASYAKEAISSLQQSGVINGRGNGYFVPQANVTRAECAKMIVTVMEGIMDGKNSFVWRE